METIMSDLLKEAIADAKAVRETALQNAKMALEEAFTPHLKSMLSAKLAEEDDEYEEDEMDVAVDGEEDAEEMARQYREDDDEAAVDIDIDADGEEEPEVEEEGIIEIDGVKYAPVVSEEDEEAPMDDEEEGEELDLEAVIKELETEIAESDNPYDNDESHDDMKPVKEEKDEDEEVKEEVVTEEDDEDEDKDEVDEQSGSSGIGAGDNVQPKSGTAADEEDPGKGKVHESVDAMQNELNEYKEAVTYLREKLHEVNILNAKLLYTNRLFKEYVLSNNQKMKVVETFDRAQTTREIKLVYSTLAESFNDRGEIDKKRSVKESASRKANNTKPQTKIISEEDNVANRFKKLAGLLKD